MKTLYLVRHAKSSWKYEGLNDLHRPLNKRGKRDAAFMAELMKKNGEIPDKIVTSPAVRANEIAKVLADKLEIKDKRFTKDKRLYMADTENFIDVIHETKDKIIRLMLVSHNMGITFFANQISDASLDNIPTSGIVRIDFETDEWKRVSEAKGKMIFFEYPKKYLSGSEN